MRASLSRLHAAGLAVGLACLGAGCGKSQAVGECTHPCDLGQSFRVEITGAEPAALITVGEPCHGGSLCRPEVPCRRGDFYLGYSPPSSGPDLVCRVTAISPSGLVVERDVAAHYIGGAGACCSGYEFGFGASVSITFEPADASSGPADASTPGDAGAPPCPASAQDKFCEQEDGRCGVLGCGLESCLCADHVWQCVRPLCP